MALARQALAYHLKQRGKLATKLLTPIKTKKDLSLAYTPGVGEVSKHLAANKEDVYKYTIKGHTVAIVTDGSAVLGLGNIGPEAALPVMEGKAALFKTFANLDAFPICLDTQEPKEIIKTVKMIAPVFGAVNLEDIAAPACFEIEEALQDLGIPVMHDDQHGTAVVVLAGLINAVKAVGKKLSSVKVVILGAGAAGFATAQMVKNKVGEVVVLDSKGIISPRRKDLNRYKKILAQTTNKARLEGDLPAALKGADVLIGVSRAGLVARDAIKLMNEGAVVFALANPVSEIMPDEAKRGGAKVVATGRSDFPNQINNCLAFPGIFQGALEGGVKRITEEMKLQAAEALAKLVEKPTANKIIPGVFEKGVARAVSKAVASLSAAG